MPAIPSARAAVRALGFPNQSPLLQSALYAGNYRHSVDLGKKRKPYRITFALDLFNGAESREASRLVLGELLRSLVNICRIQIRFNPQLPLLYQTAIKYMEEPPGQEDWQDPPTTLAMGFGDCEDISCWRVAELNERFKIDAVPAFKEQMRPDGSLLYHIVVLYPDGRIEDPSAIMGMR